MSSVALRSCLSFVQRATNRVMVVVEHHVMRLDEGSELCVLVDLCRELQRTGHVFRGDLPGLLAVTACRQRPDRPVNTNVGMRGAIPRFEEGADNERLHQVLPSAADSRLQKRLTSVQALAIKALEGRGNHAKVVEDESWWFGMDRKRVGWG